MYNFPQPIKIAFRGFAPGRVVIQDELVCYSPVSRLMPWKRRSNPQNSQNPRPQLSPAQKQHKRIERVAHELYQNRLLLGRPGDAQSDWETATKIVQSGWHTTLFASHRPLIQLEKNVWEPLLAWANNQAVLGLLGLIGNVGLIIAVITYIGSEKQRRDAEVLNAWQTLTSAHGQAGNGGRKRALEFLNASPGANWRRKFPWFCAPHPICVWPRESLAGVDLAVGSEGVTTVDVGSIPAELGDVVGAEQENNSTDGFRISETPRRVYLAGIQLSKADLWSANLQGAHLGSANLQDAYLESANLQGAHLEFTNLQGAYLWYSNLQDTDLRSASLQGARLRYANLQDTDLESVNLQGAHLWYSNLQGADLWYSNLQGASLWSADLQGASLVAANLQDAYLATANLQSSTILATDLRKTVDLSQEVLEGDNPPFICNSPLPSGIQIQGGKDRDCDRMASVLLERYPDEFGNLENAETFVKEAQEETWD